MNRSRLNEVEAVLSQLLGAVVRAAIVVIVIATPSLLIPGISAEGAQVVTLVALAAAVVIAMEYASAYPGLVEFRDAPPFNRVRIIALFVMLFCLSVVLGIDTSDSSLALVLHALGLIVGTALDFPLSPVRLVLESLPGTLEAAPVATVRVMAGLSVFVALISLSAFAVLIRLHQWPNRGSSFNVWINLPTFDPTTGGDVVRRLIRDSRVNIILGFSLPFILPVIAAVSANHMDIGFLASPHMLVWAMTLWMFLPLSLFMRGLAMGRLADMIHERRARLVASVDTDGPGASPALPSSR